MTQLVNEHSATETIPIIDMLRRALVKETAVGANDMAHIQPDFYSNIRAGISSVPDGERTEVLKLFDRLTALRLKKIQSRAIFGPATDEMLERLSEEERKLYSSFHELCKSFKDDILKGREREL